MSVTPPMAPLAPSTHYAATQQVPSSACVHLGTKPSAPAARILTNARTTPPAVLIRCVPTSRERTTALARWDIERRKGHVSTPTNVRVHRATDRRVAGTRLAPFHATAL